MYDEYSCKQLFKRRNVDQLIEAFNGDVGHNGWVGARGIFLEALRKSFLATGLDCASFIDDEGMSLKHPIKRAGKRIVLEGCSKNAK